MAKNDYSNDYSNRYSNRMDDCSKHEPGEQG